jgi:hypothetical protein
MQCSLGRWGMDVSEPMRVLEASRLLWCWMDLKPTTQLFLVYDERGPEAVPFPCDLVALHNRDGGETPAVVSPVGRVLLSLVAPRVSPHFLKLSRWRSSVDDDAHQSRPIRRQTMGKDLSIPRLLEDLVHNTLFSNALPVSFSNKPKRGKRSIET